MKRIFDIVLAIAALILLSIPLLFLAWKIRRNLGAPILFRQVRPGINGRPFEMIKFRSMTNACGDDGKLLPDSLRLPAFGKFLRASSLDELPEIWNVLRGDMSFVGPRPLAMVYLTLYSPEQFRRHEVRPGITGWAQINGRNSISWSDKFKHDIWYVDHQSLVLDVKILLLTVGQVIKKKDVLAEGMDEVESFDGSN